MSIESRSRQYGKVFDHWQIKEFLGSGSGGKTAVFRLTRMDSTRGTSALKVVNLIEERGDIHALSDYRRKEYETAREQCSRSAEQEVWLMDDLRGNTNIVDYLDHTFVDWSDETGFGRDLLIRMELLKDLRSELRNGKVFNEREVLKIGCDICTALIRCHRKNILHRDVKPENIFRNKDGDYKLGDFGVSRVLDACPGAVASTGIGTYEYWPAEQMTGSYDKRVDIYSLGLVLYELSNQNRLPFAASTYATGREVSLRLSGTELPAPADASPELAKVILKACAFNPNERYQNAEEFLKALNEVIGTVQKIQAPNAPKVIPKQTQIQEDYATVIAKELGLPESIFTDDAYSTAPERLADAPSKASFTTQPTRQVQPHHKTEPTQQIYLSTAKNRKNRNHLLSTRLLVLIILLIVAIFIEIFALFSILSQNPKEDNQLSPNYTDTQIDLVPTIETVFVTDEASIDLVEEVVTEAATETTTETIRKIPDGIKLIEGSWENGDVTVVALDDTTLWIQITDVRPDQLHEDLGTPWGINLKFGTEMMLENSVGGYAVNYPFRITLNSLAYREMKIQYKKRNTSENLSQENVKNLLFQQIGSNIYFYPINESEIDLLDIEQNGNTYTTTITLPEWFDVSVFNDLTSAQVILYDTNYYEILNEKGSAPISSHNFFP